MSTTDQNWNFPSYWNSPPAFDTIVNNASHQNFDMGIFVEWFDTPFISLLTEVHYIQNGADSRTNIFYGIINTSDHSHLSLYTRNYLSVPLLLKIRLDGTILTPYILAGPRFDFYLNHRSNGFGTALDGPRDVYVGGTFGIGVETSSILPIHLGAEFRYSPNFLDSDPVDWYGLSLNIRSMEFLIVLSY